MEGDDWSIEDFSGLSAIVFIDFLNCFQKYVSSNFRVDRPTKLFEYYKQENEKEEHYLVAIQDNNFYTFNLKEMERLFCESKETTNSEVHRLDN